MSNRIMSKRSLMLFALMLSGGSIYNLSDMHEKFEPIMLETLRITDKQFGDLRAMLGVVMMLCYIPGGWLADRFSTRNLITFSLVSTGLSGIYIELAVQENGTESCWTLTGQVVA